MPRPAHWLHGLAALHGATPAKTDALRAMGAAASRNTRHDQVISPEGIGSRGASEHQHEVQNVAG